VNKSALMIYNPSSGKRRNHKKFPLIVEKLTNMGYQINILQSKDTAHLESLIRNACVNKWDALFVAGGDGTIHEVLQSLSDELYRPKIGVFPFGTSNEFSQFIGLPHDMFKVLSVIEKGHTSLIDIGKLGERYFANIAAAGWLTDITYETPSSLKSRLGRFAYYLCFMKKLFMNKSPETLSIQIFPDTLFSDLSFLLIMNGNSVGPFKRFIPHDNIKNDGSFHLITCQTCNRLQFLFVLMITMLKLGDPFSLIKHQKISASEIHLPNDMCFNLDGEQQNVTEMLFEVLPDHLQVFTPNQK
jgi:diacylglycerol kinase (ATP)